jgi:tryptophan synthase alpha chain
MKAQGIDPIFLLAPTSSDARIQQVGALASGYVYYVSLRGVTGAGHLDAGAVAEVFPRLRAHLSLPIGVGFGIRDAASAKAVATVADAVVIGSALVQLVEQATPDNAALELRTFLKTIRDALDEEIPA